MMRIYLDGDYFSIDLQVRTLKKFLLTNIIGIEYSFVMLPILNTYLSKYDRLASG